MNKKRCIPENKKKKKPHFLLNILIKEKKLF